MSIQPSEGGKEFLATKLQERRVKANQVADNFKTSLRILSVFDGSVYEIAFVPLALIMLSFVLQPLQKFWLLGCGSFLAYILSQIDFSQFVSFSLLPIRPLVSTYAVLIVVGISYAVHTAPRITVPQWLEVVEARFQYFHVARWKIFIFVCLASGFLGALFYPQGSYFSKAVPEVFNVQIVPAILFGFVLTLCFRWVLETEKYPAGLLGLGTVAAYIIMYPVAVASWPVMPAMVGATGFGIILTLLVTLLDNRFETIKFWTCSLAISAISAIPFEFDVIPNLLEVENVELKAYCQGLSLFVIWETTWVTMLLILASTTKLQKMSDKTA